MSTTPRSRLQIDERRDQLLDVGLRLFSNQSYESVQIGDIATAAGVSKGLLYHYFGGKRDFYVACVEAAAARLHAAIDPNPDDPPAERVRQSLVAYLDFVDERADAYIALMHGGLGADERVIEIVRATRYGIVNDILEGLGLTEPRPAFRAAARAWIGSVEALCIDWLRHRDLDREFLTGLLVASLYTHMLIAVQHDPEAGVVLQPIF